jgi:hypothetical protein
MCFNNDYDWYADVWDVTDGENDVPAKCIECGLAIASGEWRRHVYLQEDEECYRCEQGDLKEGDEPCEVHDYGEIFECSICETCCKILKAIEAVEIDEGCPVGSRQPLYGELSQALFDDANCGDGKYAARALAEHPELRELFPREWERGA